MLSGWHIKASDFNFKFLSPFRFLFYFINFMLNLQKQKRTNETKLSHEEDKRESTIGPQALAEVSVNE